MEDKQKELLRVIDDEIIQTRAGRRLAIMVGGRKAAEPWDKQSVALQAIRRLVEKFYGEWNQALEPYANSTAYKYFRQDYPQLAMIIRQIRDFGKETTDE